MGKEKEKVQQPDNGQGKDKFETIGTLLSVVALSIFFGFILMAIATTVENSAKSILSIISSVMFTIAAIVIIADIVIKQILHQNNIKKIVLSVFAILFIALCTGILIVSGINTVYKTEILSDIIYWLVAAVMIVVSIAVITLQFLINKNDFEQNPIKSYAVIILTMLYALTYAMIVKPDIVFNITFTIHTIASLTVFINIIFKTGIKSKNIIQLALFVIAVVALMAQMIYCIYIWFFNVEYPDLFNSIMGVFAGLLGGVLTLIGVAWTIKRQDEIRKEDEKKKIKPYISFIMIDDVNAEYKDLKICMAVNKNFTNNITVILENSDLSICNINRVYHDDNWFDLFVNNVILQNGKVVLSIFCNNKENIVIEVSDILNNKYYYRMIPRKKPISGGDNNQFTILSLNEVDMNFLRKNNIPVGESYDNN